MKLSEEVRNWYYVGDEIPAKEWADRIAELEAELKEAKECGKGLLDEVDMLNTMVDALKKDRDAFREKVERSVTLLRAAGCPICDGSGSYHEHDGSQGQCQWCFEVDALALKEVEG